MIPVQLFDLSRDAWHPWLMMPVSDFVGNKGDDSEKCLPITSDLIDTYCV